MDGRRFIAVRPKGAECILGGMFDIASFRRGEHVVAVQFDALIEGFSGRSI